MEKLINTILLIMVAMAAFSQSMSDLDRNPSFKKITIGESVSKYSDILQYRGTYKGKNSYVINDRQYYSIFNIEMDKAVVVEDNGKVYAVLLSKTNSQETFNPKELEVLKSSLAFRYGSPNVDLTDFSGSPSITGYRWQSRSIMLDIAYLFHGTFEGSELKYFLYQRNDDY